MEQNKYSTNHLYKVTYFSGEVEMISAKSILDFVTSESQHDIQSIEVVAISKFSKEIERKQDVKIGTVNFPGFVEY